ncbi:MAG: alanine racemase [Nitriliruptorales bacterium]|nr:alanine racemase [Nitriliruptorales bacterium]
MSTDAHTSGQREATHLVVSGGPASTRGAPRPKGTARTEPPAQRDTWAEIDLDAIAANVAALKAQATAPQLMAVVKADGYGHGLVPAARAALAGGAEWLGVALVEEGAALRAAGLVTPILVMAEPPPRAVNALLDAQLTPAVYSAVFLDALDAAVRARDAAPVGVHLKLDTGMRRVGVPESDWDDALRHVRDAPALRLQGLWSHLAVADEPGNAFTEIQALRFRRGLRLAARLGVQPDLAHLCNSAGTIALHDEQHDLVRAGIAIYGLRPSTQMTVHVPLRPALRWYSRLSLVKRLSPGEAVSYGLRWAAEEPTTLGTVPAGYADGVNRALSNRGRALVRGRARPMVGTVCMDQFLVDIGHDRAEAGDEVVLIGEQGDARVTAEDWADLLDTITYEIVCGVGRRVPRVYVGGEG